MYKLILALIVIASLGWALTFAYWNDNRKIGTENWELRLELADKQELENDLDTYERIIGEQTSQLRQCREDLNLWEAYFGTTTLGTIKELSK